MVTHGPKKLQAGSVDETANIAATNIIKSAILYENELFGSVIRKIGPGTVAVILIAAAPILVLDENLSTVPTDAVIMVDDDVVYERVRPPVRPQRARYVPRLEMAMIRPGRIIGRVPRCRECGSRQLRLNPQCLSSLRRT